MTMAAPGATRASLCKFESCPSPDKPLSPFSGKGRPSLYHPECQCVVLRQQQRDASTRYYRHLPQTEREKRKARQRIEKFLTSRRLSPQLVLDDLSETCVELVAVLLDAQPRTPTAQYDEDWQDIETLEKLLTFGIDPVQNTLIIRETATALQISLQNGLAARDPRAALVWIGADQVMRDAGVEGDTPPAIARNLWHAETSVKYWAVQKDYTRLGDALLRQGHIYRTAAAEGCGGDWEQAMRVANDASRVLSELCSPHDREILMLRCEAACLRLRLLTSHARDLDGAACERRELGTLLEAGASPPVKIAALNEEARYFTANHDYGNAKHCFAQVDDLLLCLPDYREYLRVAIISPRLELLLTKEPLDSQERAQAASLISEYFTLCRNNPNTYHLRRLRRWLVKAQQKHIWLDPRIRKWEEPSATVFSSGYILTAWDQRGQKKE